MKRNLRMKCPSCGQWSRVLVNKIFIEQNSLEPKVQVLIPMYEPLEAVRCEKCGQLIAEPRELIKIRKGKGMSEKDGARKEYLSYALP